MSWHQRFLQLADQIGNWSKDPIVKVGAIIVDENRRIIGTGYNGFARGVKDTSSRYENKTLKKQIVIHAEVNAILNCVSSMENSTLYVTYLPCPTCAGIIIQVGISKVIAKSNSRDARHKDQIDLTIQLFNEAGVRFYIV